MEENEVARGPREWRRDAVAQQRWTTRATSSNAPGPRAGSHLDVALDAIAQSPGGAPWPKNHPAPGSFRSIERHESPLRAPSAAPLVAGPSPLDLPRSRATAHRPMGPAMAETMAQAWPDYGQSAFLWRFWISASVLRVTHGNALWPVWWGCPSPHWAAGESWMGA